MFKTLSLVLTDETADAPALEAAAAIALREDAHLDVTCLGVEPVPIEAMAVGAVGLALQVQADAQAQARSLAAWARRVLPQGARAAVEPLTAPDTGLGEWLARTARFSDLAVVARPYGARRGPFTARIVETLLFGTSSPVLVVPA